MVTEGVKVRIVQPEEWPAIREVFAEQGGTAPHPDHAIASVAIDEQGLAGFWVCQTVLHAGPLWIRPDHRGTRLWWPLNKMLVSLVKELPNAPGFYSFSDGPRMNHVFKQLGYQDMNYKVWKLEV